MVAEQRDRYREPVEVLKAMSTYAPTLGMLGTLLGLVQMLFGLGEGEMGVIGSSMGFALLTTVYGLALSNLVLKPLAGKLEHRGREAVADGVSHMQAVMLLHDRHHTDVIRDFMHRGQPTAQTPPTPDVQLAAAG